MIGYAIENGRIKPVDAPLEALDRVVWLDLYQTTPAEIEALEEALDVDIPTRDEMEEIEISSRLYHEDHAWFMTVTLPANATSDNAEMAPVSFVLTEKLLITVRTTDPRAFRTFPKRAMQADLELQDAATLLLALQEAIVDRLADILESAGREIERISNRIFIDNAIDTTGKSSFQDVLRRLGRQGDLLSDLRESLMTMSRVSGYFSLIWPRLNSAAEQPRERLKTLGRDIQSISEHASFMTQKVTFLLDATLGMINIEQNATIKIFSVLAVVFLPPTLIASIYGMNFEFMPELGWKLGYPMAVVMMIAAAVIPYWWFKRKGWL